MQLEYEPPRPDDRASLQLLIVEFGGGMLVGTMILCLVLWQLAFLACFPFYALIPLIEFSIALLIRSWLLRSSYEETHWLFTISTGALCIAAEFFGAWFIDKVDGSVWYYPLVGGIFLLPLVSGWVALRKVGGE